jgi:bla regulator protein blaR1
MKRADSHRKRMLITIGFAVALIALGPGLMRAPQIRAQSQPEQATAKLPSFEIVSVKPYPSNYWPTSSYMEFTAVGFNWRNTTAQDLLVYAYALCDPHLSDKRRLIPGGAKWMNLDWLDVQAKMSEENIAALYKLSPKQQEVYKRQLLQSLLADRFELRVHHVTREGIAWELTVAKGGPKNMKREPDDIEGRPILEDMNHVRFEAAPIAMLVEVIGILKNAPVLDKTGITGKYDFKVEFSRDSDTEMPPGEALPPTNDSEPTIVAALKDQLGLKLVPIKIPFEEIVIDHIERPSPN